MADEIGRGRDSVPKLTPKQRRLGELRAADPLAPEGRLMRQASYSVETSKSPRQNLPQPGGSHLLARLVTEEQARLQPGSARQLRDAAHAETMARIGNGTASDALLLGSYKVGGEVLAQEGGDAEGVSLEDRGTARSFVERVIRSYVRLLKGDAGDDNQPEPDVDLDLLDRAMAEATAGTSWAEPVRPHIPRSDY